MLEPKTVPTRIVVAPHPKLPAAVQEAAKVTQFLEQQGLDEVANLSLYDENLRSRMEAKDFDLLIALGGDGTMLRAGHLVASMDLPILGINVGRFGFLTEVKRDEWTTALPLLFQKKYRLEERMMIQAEHWRGEELLGNWNVLNEVVVARGQMVRPIRVRALIDGYPLATFVADGLIASTPTGSTAYALAAGGPIMPPELRNILIIPVAPHLSVDRALILAEGVRVTMIPCIEHQSVLSVDGQSAIQMQDGDEVRVASGEHNVHFVRFQDPGYFYRNLTAYMEQNPSANGVK
jgi:NAD+ kinase